MTTQQMSPHRRTSTLRGSSVRQPAKLLRIASVARAMLEEARSSSCDASGCDRLRAIFRRTVEELDEVLSPDLIDELTHLIGPLEKQPVDLAAVRLVQAELVGWLEGLFSGIFAAQAVQVQTPAELQEPSTVDGHPGNYL